MCRFGIAAFSDSWVGTLGGEVLSNLDTCVGAPPMGATVRLRDWLTPWNGTDAM